MIKNLINLDSGLLLYVNTLVAVGETKSYREAAARLGISQPAVSQHMKALEERLQAPLSKSIGKRKELTSLGRELAKSAKAHFAQLQTGILSAYNRHQEGAEVLRVGSRPEILQYVLPQMKFKGSFHCQIVSAAEAVDRLLRAEIDLAVSYLVPDSPEIFNKKAFVSSPTFIVHRSLWSGGLKAEKLLEIPAVTYRYENDPMQELMTKMKADPNRLKRRVVCEDWSVLKSLVEQKMGFSVVPNYVAKGMSKEVLQIDPSDFGLKTYTYYYLYRREDKSQFSSWLA